LIVGVELVHTDFGVAFLQVVEQFVFVAHGFYHFLPGGGVSLIERLPEAQRCLLEVLLENVHVVALVADQILLLVEQLLLAARLQLVHTQAQNLVLLVDYVKVTLYLPRLLLQTFVQGLLGAQVRVDPLQLFGLHFFQFLVGVQVRMLLVEFVGQQVDFFLEVDVCSLGFLECVEHVDVLGLLLLQGVA